MLKKPLNNLNESLIPDGYHLVKIGSLYQLEKLENFQSNSKIKNIIFAANGPKPEIVLKDATTNDIQIVKMSNIV